VSLPDRLTELVAVASPTGAEHDAVDLLTDWLQAGPAQEVDRFTVPMSELERDPEYPGREVERHEVPVVAARRDLGSSGPTVVLTGHVDTVAVGEPSRWSHDPSGERQGDRLYGRGACDMKAGLVAALAAFEEIADHPDGLSGEIRFVAVPGEEDGGTGTLAAIRRGWAGDHVIVAEPTSAGAGPDVVIAHGGALTMTIEVEGRSAHGSVPGEGESALDHFYTVYRAMREVERTVNASVEHPLMRRLPLPHATTVGVVRGGWWASNVMEQITAEARIGVPVGQTTSEAEEAFREAVLRLTAEDPWLAEHPPSISLTGAAFGSSSIEQDHPLVAAVVAAAAEATGRTPELRGAPYGCDMALWRRVGGAAAVVYGPGDVALAHAPDEWVSISETTTAAATLAGAARRLLNV
jgi:acetylornithine deacetylase